MNNTVVIRRSVQKYQGPRAHGDNEVTRAVDLWARACEWPRWFAKNVVLWRRARKLHWQSCEVQEVQHG